MFYPYFLPIMAAERLETDNRVMNASDNENFDSPMRGYLLIHVGGYKMFSDFAGHLFPDGEGGNISIPDRLVQAETHPFGTDGFYADGWAVGDNPRERFCKWHGLKPMRRFHDFDEAVAYTYSLRQKRKRSHEVYTLVYVTKGVDGRECQCPVSSLDDISAFENEIAEKVALNNWELEMRRQKLSEEYPELDRLLVAYGVRKAFTLSKLLKTIRSEGKGKAMQNMPESSFYRGIAELRKIGLLDTKI